MTPDRLDRVLALNNANAAQLSWLDPDRLALLVCQSFWAARIGDVDAFVLTFDHKAEYDGLNYRWFRDRFDRFAYVDRVVVTPTARGRGLARRLYDGVLEAAKAAGHSAIMAEVNCEPPNPASDAFHASFGFQEIGRAGIPPSIHGEARTVRYLTRRLP